MFFFKNLITKLMISFVSFDVFLSRCRCDLSYASQWSGFEPNQSIRFWLLGPNRTESKAQESNHWNFGSVRFLSGWNRLEPTQREYKKLLISSLRCGANIYMYMHVLYAACARDEKKFFFAKIIEPNRSFSKQFEFCKSDKNWAQLLALKLRQMLKLFATQYFDVLDVLTSSQAKKKQVTCFTVTLISTATLTEHDRLIARFFKYDDSDSEMIHLIHLLYDVSRG
jgi:hypothetical protein